VDFFRFPKIGSFSAPQKSYYFGFSKNSFSLAPRKIDFYVIRLIALSGHHEKSIFSVSEIPSLRAPLKSNCFVFSKKNFFVRH
jgi:hypothetical protein